MTASDVDAHIYIVDDVVYESASLLDADLDAATWQIDGVMTKADKIVIFAAPGTGKSILVQQLASCLLSGDPFLGYRPEVDANDRVLFLAGEGDLAEIQSRGRRMRQVFDAGPDRLYYWPVPIHPMNTAKGLSRLLEFASRIQPTLTVFDPIYSFMVGSMSDDEKAGDLLRNANRLQHDTGTTIVFTHHTHKPVRDDKGQKIVEDDGGYFGSMLWAAWARQMWSLRRDGADEHYVELKVTKDRNAVSKLGTTQLMLVEPQPLLFVPRVKGWGPTTTAVVQALKLTPSMTVDDLVVYIGKDKSTVYEAVRVLKDGGTLTGDGGWPEKWSTTSTV